MSPKLSNSIPTGREGGRFAAVHDKHRLNPGVIQQFIDSSPEFQLKFVVTGERDLAEIDEILAGVRGWKPGDVLLMPEGIDAAALASRAAWISETCKQRGFRYCPRLHVMLYGNKRGT
jgi:7-carboxy-7-deazaguanine synthase